LLKPSSPLKEIHAYLPSGITSTFFSGGNEFSKKTKISVQLFFASPGKISYMSSLESLVSDGLILDGRFNFKVGDNIPKIKNATQRAGHFIVSSSNKDSLFEKVDKVFNKVKILDEDGNNLVIPYKLYNQM